MLVLDQPLPKVGQARRIEAGKVGRQVERHLPAQVEHQALHRLFVGHVVVKLEQQHATHQRGWQARPAVARIVQLFQVVVLEQHAADRGHATVKRVSWYPIRQVLSRKQALLGITTSEHGAAPVLDEAVAT